jgi:hypothetical protein
MDQFAKTLQFTISDSGSELKLVILMENGFYLNMTAKLKITHNFSDDLLPKELMI